MKPVTCQEMYDALTASIEERWKPIVRNGGMRLPKTPQCQLCKIHIRIEIYDMEVYETCNACPLKIAGKKLGCSAESDYRAWANEFSIDEKKAKAQAVLDELIAVRDELFPEGWDR